MIYAPHTSEVPNWHDLSDFFNSHRHILANLHKNIMNYSPSWITSSISENRMKILLIMFEFPAFRQQICSRKTSFYSI